jgi:excisionase family DNA binding protein
MGYEMKSSPDRTTVMDGERFCLSVTETARAVGISKPVIWGAIAQGRLKVARSGRRVLVPVAAIEEWLKSLMTAGRPGVGVERRRDAEEARR